MSNGASAAAAAREASAQAYRAFGAETPKLAIVFTSVDYPDANEVARTVREVVGDVVVVGGTAGGSVIGPNGVAPKGVSVVLLGGDDLTILTRTAGLAVPELVDIVPAAREIAQAADEAARTGFEHYSCLVFAPGLVVDGEALVAAVRKGAGARAQLAGGLSGDNFTFDRPRIFVGEELRNDQVVLVGLFTRKPVGIAARHGWQPVGPSRVVTRADGLFLRELDHRPALDVWVEDARKAGGMPPTARTEIVAYLANHYELGIADVSQKKGDAGELVVRAPMECLDDGSVRMTASIGEGLRVQVVQTSRKDLLRAATDAVAGAVMRARGKVAGAVVFACSARLTVLGEEFKEEGALIRNRAGAPIGGSCVFGEIARNERDTDAFFNTTVVVVAFPS